MKKNNPVEDRMESENSVAIRQHSDDWLVSYSDLVTVLLCFFIMFFVIKVREQEKSFQALLKTPKEDQQTFIQMSQELNSSLQNQRLNLKKFDNHLALDVSSRIFDKSSENLALDGKFLFTQIAGVAFKYMPNVQMQLSIGTDGDNLDGISLARIGLVRNYLIELGLMPELITVGTFKKSATDSNLDQVKIFISKNYTTSGNE